MDYTNLDMIDNLHQIERTKYIVYDYIQYFDTEDRYLLETRRREICSWMYRFVDSHNLCRDLVSRSMSYFDRFLMTIIIRKDLDVLMHRAHVTESSFLQLAALVSLNLAMKIHSELKLDLRHMIKVSRAKFDLTELIDMERRMLYVLAWRLNPPTSAEFVMHLSSLLFDIAVIPELANHFDDIVNMAIFLTELAMWDSYFIECNASTLAIASLLNAVETINSNKEIINTHSLTSFMIILQSSDFFPHQETLHNVRSRVHGIFFESKCGKEVTDDMLEQSATSQCISLTRISQEGPPISASR